MQDAYYSEISPSDTGLVILTVHSKDTPAWFKTMKYLISNQILADFLLFSVYTSLS